MARTDSLRLKLTVCAVILVAGATGLARQSVELQTLRNQGKAMFEEQRFGEAVAAFAQAVLDTDAGVQDYINLAAAQYRSGDDPAALATLEAFADPLSGNPGAPLLRGMIARRNGDIEGARVAFEAAGEMDPTDPAIRYSTGAAYAQLGLRDEALLQFEAVIAMGFDVGVQHYVSALYQHLQILLRQGRRDEAEPLIARYRESSARLTPAARSPGALDLSRWTAIIVPGASVQPAAPGTAPQVRFDEIEFGAPVTVGGTGGIAVADFNLDGRQDWVHSGAQGSVWLSTDSGYQTVPLATPAGPIGVGDFDRDGRPDLYVASDTGDRLYRNVVDEAGGPSVIFEPVAAEGLPTGGSPSHVLWVDFDHDGDLDVLVTHGTAAGAAGSPRLLRNQGSGVFSDATVLAGFDQPRPDIGALWADFDRDFDVDLLLWGADGTTLYSNQRGGVFDDVTVAVGARVAAATVAAVAEDFDNDGRIDIVLATAAGIVVLRNVDEGRFLPAGTEGLRDVAADALQVADFNNDGYLDLVAAVDGGLRFFVNAGDFEFVPFDPLPPAFGLVAPGEATRHLTAADLDGNGAVDVLVEQQGVLRLLLQPAAIAPWVAIALTGVKNNVQGIGATIEVKAGGSYQVRPLRTTPLHFGIGTARTVEVVRIRWPNGIVQNLLDPATEELLTTTELERLEGSCPFLYTWDGERWHFVNEVLGASPLGMLLAEGVYHVPDGDEYVFVPGENLRPRDGQYELRLTEELRETGYIDAVRILVVDHPESLSFLPDEGFGGVPRPDLRLHLFDRLLPVRARDQQGRDWTEALASVDGVWAVPFELGAYDGLATEHTITLTLPDASADSGDVQLYLSGWVYWSMGSINLAVDQDPAAAFTPVSLEVPDGRGGWRTAIEDIGLPIAKNTTLIVDVGEVLERSDPRVRLRTTMRLYWDAVTYTVGGTFVGGAVPAGDWQEDHGVPRAGALELRAADGSMVPLRVEVLAPLAADLRPRGFSALSRTPEGYEVFDYQTVLQEAPWEQHRGFYTRFGEVGELLQSADDRYILLGAGDEVAIRFAAPDRPLPEGWRRDFLVYLNGWVKDTDVNTKYGDRVAPLPFQGMSAYPYPLAEGYPDDEAHRAFLEQYLTRPPRPINAPLNGGR